MKIKYISGINWIKFIQEINEVKNEIEDYGKEIKDIKFAVDNGRYYAMIIYEE